MLLVIGWCLPLHTLEDSLLRERKLKVNVLVRWGVFWRVPSGRGSSCSAKYPLRSSKRLQADTRLSSGVNGIIVTNEKSSLFYTGTCMYPR